MRQKDKQIFAKLICDVFSKSSDTKFKRIEEFEILNNGDILKICVELEHSALLILMGAGDGKYNNLLKESIHRTENVSYTNPMGQGQGSFMQPPQPKKGFINKMKDRFVGG